MKPTPRADALQINEDLDFEERQWQVQRVAWCLLALLLLAGLLGPFGSGPLSHATASADALTVEYDRVARERARSEQAVQPALTASDDSMTNSLLLVLTLIGLDIGLSMVMGRSKRLEQLVDDVPLVLVVDGQPLQQRLDKARVDESDILTSARMHQGLERMEQIRFAILERSGGISIVPKTSDAA